MSSFHSWAHGFRIEFGYRGFIASEIANRQQLAAAAILLAIAAEGVSKAESSLSKAKIDLNLATSYRQELEALRDMTVAQANMDQLEGLNP